MATKSNKMSTLESRFYTPNGTSGALADMRRGFTHSENLTRRNTRTERRHHRGVSETPKANASAIAELKRRIIRKRMILAKIDLWRDGFCRRISGTAAKRQQFTEFMLEAGGSCLQISGGGKRKYAFLKCIGKGGFSVVWEVLDLHSCNTAAAKFTMYPNAQKQPEAAQWLDRCLTKEVMAFSKEAHPHLLNITDFFHWRLDESTHHGFATVHELCKYDLSHWLKYATYEQRNSGLVMKWLRQIAYGLDRLHQARHIVHMDLKPQNLLVSLDEELIKISDFGLHLVMEEGEDETGKFRASLDMSDRGNWTGSIAYQPPEHWRARLAEQSNYSVDAQFDIWSLGCIAFELWSGERLFNLAGTGMKDISQIYEAALDWYETTDLQTRLLAAIHCEHKRAIVYVLLNDRPTGSELIKLFS